MFFVDAEKVQLFGGSFEVSGGVSLGGLSLLEGALGDGSLVIEKLGAIELNVSQALIVLGLDINLVGAGNVGALDAQQNLPFFNRVAQLGLDLDNAAGGKRNDRNRPNDVRLNDSSGVKSGNG